MAHEESGDARRPREGVWDWVVNLEPLWVALAIAMVYLMVIEDDASSARGPMFFLSIFVAIWFLISFAGDDARVVRRAVRFSYIFTFGSFAVVALAPAISAKGEQSADGPIGIIRGCDERKDQGLKIETIACLPRPDRIENRTIREAPGPAPGRSSADTASTSGGAGSAGASAGTPDQRPSRSVLLLHIGGVTAVREQLAPDVTKPSRPPSKSEQNSGVPAKAREPTGETPSGELGTQPDTRQVRESRQPGDTDQQHYYVVHKGLIVPFYVVLLSLVGAAVSLSRRVPEIQKRVADKYVGTPTEPKLFEWEAREQLVFQVLQYLSAPFIAIAAYYVVKPTTVPAEVGLAFLSGFASETILLLIRGALTGLRPQTAQTFQKGTIHGQVRNAAGEPQAKVKVSISPKASQDSQTTDDGGAFSFTDVPPGTYRLTTEDGRGTATATVISGAAVNVEIRLKSST